MARPIGALWLRKTKDGKTYMSGVLNDLSGDINIAVFKNDRKEKETQPDYQIVLSEKKEQRREQPKDDFFGDAPVEEEPLPNQDEEIRVENIPF